MRTVRGPKIAAAAAAAGGPKIAAAAAKGAAVAAKGAAVAAAAAAAGGASSTSAAVAADKIFQNRTRPAFEKLIIGPIMVFGEMITGGHYLEVLRLGKQLAVGKETSPSYLHLHRAFVSESGGNFFGAFYRGFLPWGLIQCAKGVPVLFVQHESLYQLRHRFGWSNQWAQTTSGFLGGFAQAIFVNPFQKVKVLVVACPEANAMGPLDAARAVVHRHGILSLYDGVVPMMMRRSLDWGIRFEVSNRVKQWVVQQKLDSGQSPTVSVYELVCCGFAGGAASGIITHPIDNMITNSQKPMPDGKRRDLVSVVRRMFRESGVKAFTRGYAIKVLDNSYHMAWMYGIGTVVYDWMDQRLRNDVVQNH